MNDLRLLFFETEFHCVAKTDHKLTVLLPQPPKCWDHKHKSLHVPSFTGSNSVDVALNRWNSTLSPEKWCQNWIKIEDIRWCLLENRLWLREANTFCWPEVKDSVLSVHLGLLSLTSRFLNFSPVDITGRMILSCGVVLGIIGGLSASLTYTPNITPGIIKCAQVLEVQLCAITLQKYIVFEPKTLNVVD
jgi:hypothetical protein